MRAGGSERVLALAARAPYAAPMADLDPDAAPVIRPHEPEASAHALPDATPGVAPPNALLIVDFGSQVTQLIARRVRETGVYCEIVPFSSADEAMARLGPKAVILSGGPASVTEEGAPMVSRAFIETGVPMLGICYGQQAMVAALGGSVSPSSTREFGRADLTVAEPSTLTDGIWGEGTEHQVWMSHGDRVETMPDGFRIVATSPGAPHAMIADERRRLYGVQFHPEVVHTPDGAKLIERFVRNVGGLDATWSMAAYRERSVAAIREQVGEGRVLCALSGGVDSSVAALLIHEAIGERLHCVLVDYGLMRLGEADEVVTMFREHYDVPLTLVDASDTFLGELAGVTDPERKRKVIGRLFIETFEREAKRLEGDGGPFEFLAQGTLYPDVIESVSFTGGPSVTIKSHHNVGGLPERMGMKLVEPLRELFKDEVRALGRELGLPDRFVGRHPFPGPGLAIRIPGEVTREACDTLRQADAIYLEEIRRAGLYDVIWQAFAALLPVRTVGVMGDGRTYERVLALRAVSSVDGMTADFHPFDMAFLGRVATRIVNEVRGVNRVVYDVTSKPPGTIEWE